MSEPISAVDFRSIQPPDSATSNGDGTSYQQPSSRTYAVDTRGVESMRADSANKQAAAVQTRLQEAGSKVRVGVETVNGNTVFTVRDATTGQVIRKIPSDEALRISQNLDRLTGLYLDRLE